MIIDNRYQVLKKLGIGGTGEVYRVYDRVKDREIVLKLLIYSKSEESLLLLKKEFLAITKLKHSYIIEVYDFVLPKEGTPYFTMEYIDGVDIIKATNNLRVKSRNSQIPITHNLLYTLIVQLCQALEFIHSHGLIHCDIKPGNILITRDKKHSADFKFYPKLLDFGLIESVDLSTTVGMRGTVEYMAPEMIKGYFVDRRTDLYSLGVVLYEAVTGKLPFEGDTPLSILKQHLGRNPISPNEYVKDIPDDLNRIILKLLSKYPGTRYQSGREIIHDISQIIGKEFELPSEKGWFLSSGFVGREKELSCLDNFLSEKRGKGVFITGEVGIGKSRLVEEFRIQAQLKGCSFWKGICYPGEREIYGPIVEILNELIPILKLRHPDLLEDYRESLIHFVPGLECYCSTFTQSFPKRALYIVHR
ncbi:MAG: serine/threonine-protein kinase PknK [Candidatus Stahlbacteria bacterium]|nr:serine/threonine-protein kinase PknK [Candidatus Stahlbacteria bacterium]